MAASKNALAAPKSSALSKTELNSSQVLKASTALLRKIQSDQTAEKASAEKPSLLDDADDADADDEIPVWLVLTTKKHVTDKKRLKPGKILLPHPYLDPKTTTSPTASTENTLRICLITADPQRTYKDLIASPSFPVSLSTHITRVIGVSKLKAKYKSFESRRQLLAEYDLFLADDRIITALPQYLGKTFYKSSSKRPVPVALEGKRHSVDAATGQKRRRLADGGTKVVRDAPVAADVAHEIERTLKSALVHLSPSTTTSVKVGRASMLPEELSANIEAVVEGLVEKYVPKKWANVRAVHVKGPKTAALPVWMAEELWEDEADVLEKPIVMKESKRETKRKRALLENPDVIEVPGADGKIRQIEKPSSKRKSLDDVAVVEKPSKKVKSGDDGAKVEKEARKFALQKQKEAAKASLATLNGDTPKPAVTRKTRAKGADLL